MRVLIPSPLRSYTGGGSEIEGAGWTLGDLLGGMEDRFPGIRFRIIDEQDRIRPHIRIFVRGEAARGINHPIGPDDEVQIVCALSGG